MSGRRFVLSADRSQISNFRFNFLFGFLSSGPVKISPEPIYSMICPTDDTYNAATGEMNAAPLGLRRVQSALEIAYGTDSVVAQHPYEIERAIGEDTEVVGLSEMSPLGMGPVDTAVSWTNTPWNRMWFTRLLKQLRRLKEKFNFKLVVGGPGSWQLLEREATDFLASRRIRPRMKDTFGVDHVVEGEADKLAPQVFESIASGNAPEVITLLTNSISSIDDIPEIRYPTLTSLVECMRGCGRGCEFCAPNLRTKRDFAPERVAREAAINIRYGYRDVWLQTEELTLYGCESKDKWPNRDAVLELYGTLRHARARQIGATHWTFAGVRACPELIADLSKMNGLDREGCWMGVQPGLEYASPRMVSRYMPYKVKPFTPEEYPETVREGIRIMNKYHYYPACTLIIGSPGEEPDEVDMTIDLIETLSTIDKVHGIFAPLLYVDYLRPHQTMRYDRMTEKHWRLFYICWRHNVREFREKIWVATQSFGMVEKLISAAGAYAIGWHIMRFLKSEFRRRFGYVPDWMT